MSSIDENKDYKTGGERVGFEYLEKVGRAKKSLDRLNVQQDGHHSSRPIFKIEMYSSVCGRNSGSDFISLKQYIKQSDEQWVKGWCRSRCSSIDIKDKFGNTPLIWAARLGQPRIVQILLEANARAEIANKRGITALMFAVFYMHKESVNILLHHYKERRLDVNQISDQCGTALMVATWKGDLECMQMLLSAGAKIDIRGKDWESCLLYAVMKKNYKAAEIFIPKFDVNLRCKNGVTPLMVACDRGMGETAWDLIDKGDANVCERDHKYRNSLMYACNSGSVACVKQFLAAGSPTLINDQDALKMTALMYAVYNNHAHVVTELISKKADLEKKNEDGETALIIAVQRGYIKCVEMLVNNECEIDACDNLGQTSIMYASMYGELDCLKFLILMGADTSLTNTLGQTALMLAISHGVFTCTFNLIKSSGYTSCQTDPFIIEEGCSPIASTKSLAYDKTKLNHNFTPFFPVFSENKIQPGLTADINATDNHGDTSLILTARLGNLMVLEALILSGAKLDIQNNEAATALVMALRYGNIDCALHLIRSGADVNIPDKDGTTPLIEAAASNYDACLIEIIKYGGEVNSSDSFGHTALMEASVYGQTKSVEILAPCVDINIKSRQGLTALMLAANYNHHDCLEILLKNKPEVDAVDSDGVTSLMVAAGKGYLYCVEVLAHAGAQLDLQDSDGVTALMRAAKFGHSDVVDRLLKLGASPDIKNSRNETAFSYANFHKHENCVLLLNSYFPNHETVQPPVLLLLAQENKAKELKECLQTTDVNVCNENGDTALMQAALAGSTGCLTLLIEAGANVNQINHDGQTALFMACVKGNVKCLELLINNYTDVRMQDVYGETALMHAALAGSTACLDKLILAGADVNQVNHDGQTALFMATYTGNTECMALLIKYRADVNVQDAYGVTALMDAASKGSIACLNMLMARCDNINKQDNDGNTALMRASKAGADACVEELIRYGANPYQRNKAGVTALMMAEDSQHTQCVKILNSYKIHGTPV